MGDSTMLRGIMYFYFIMSGITFVILSVKGEIVIERRDGKEVTKNEETVMKFIVLMIWSLLWFIMLPAIIRGENNDE